ncbi:hypothetical protein Nepgr_017736 [Nepenthes gracilis]|uniref:Uncharacterized protein n=1 Tax=Nepenthes gracilis TaxID=150966 RepID=A0AAD3SS05_NEPGR|nr:hypothetical protein Nepgr_017736 [Nepenthes gracilis]
MIGARSSWVHSSRRIQNLQQRRPLCKTNNDAHNGKQPTCTNSSNSKGKDNVSDMRDLEAYRDLDKLNFMKAAKILFTTPPKKKKFGIDFHLVQLFFVCMPSLAVYLVAQYARYEMRKMEAELELKKKAEEEEKEREKEASAAEKERMGTDPELLQVKERLEALEEKVKEIAVEAKKRPADNITKILDGTLYKKDPTNGAEAINTAPTGQPTPNQAALGSTQQRRMNEPVAAGVQDHKVKTA